MNSCCRNDEFYKKNKYKNIILVGMPCSGKTTVGRYISDKLHYEFVDTDILIEEKENMCISEIFNRKGEMYFREREKELLDKFLEVEKKIISTGGGMPIFFRNMNLLKEIGIVIFLNTDINELISRAMKVNDRPLFKDISKGKQPTGVINNRISNDEKKLNKSLEQNHEEFIKNMYDKRISIYNSAHININPKNMTIQELGDYIIELSRISL